MFFIMQMPDLKFDSIHFKEATTSKMAISNTHCQPLATEPGQLPPLTFPCFRDLGWILITDHLGHLLVVVVVVFPLPRL